MTITGRKIAMITNATKAELNEALTRVNEKYDGNISFETLETKSKNRISFTLRAKTGERGARFAASGRRLPKASWHVHGDFFDALFDIREDIFIHSLGKKITKDEGNWEDRRLGSIMNPVRFSQTSIF